MHHILILLFLTARELVPYRIKQLGQFSEEIGSMDASEKLKRTTFPWRYCISPVFSHCSSLAQSWALASEAYFWVLLVICSVISYTPHALQHALPLAKHFLKSRCLHRFFFQNSSKKRSKLPPNSVYKPSFQMCLILDNVRPSINNVRFSCLYVLICVRVYVSWFKVPREQS